jgi:hypothetical protein
MKIGILMIVPFFNLIAQLKKDTFLLKKSARLLKIAAECIGPYGSMENLESSQPARSDPEAVGPLKRNKPKHVCNCCTCAPAYFKLLNLYSVTAWTSFFSLSH